MYLSALPVKRQGSKMTSSCNQFISVKEAAAIVGVSESLFRNLVRDGRLPKAQTIPYHLRVNGVRVGYMPEQIEEAIKKGIK